MGMGMDEEEERRGWEKGLSGDRSLYILGVMMVYGEERRPWWPCWTCGEPQNVARQNLRETTADATIAAVATCRYALNLIVLFFLLQRFSSNWFIVGRPFIENCY